MEHNKIIIGTSVLSCGLAIALGILAVKYQNANVTIAQLETQLKQQKESEKRAMIVKCISSQMEEIAYSQKEISDDQRIKAEHQTQIATQMRNRSEIERQNALKAEHQAMLAKQKAVESSKIAETERLQAEHQRSLAEDRRLQAEYSMRVADTLSYLSLARSLGSMSITQYRSANYDLAALLSCSAYEYSNEYGGNVYQPAIYQPLSLSCKSTNSWSEHEGALTRIAIDPHQNGRFVTAGSYGQLFLNRFAEGKLEQTPIIKNKDYDFRDACIDNKGNIYAVSRSGHLLIKDFNIKGKSVALFPKSSASSMRNKDAVRMISIDGGKNLLRVIPDNGNLILVSECQIASYDLANDMITVQQPLDFTVTAVGQKDSEILLFGDNNNYYVLPESTANKGKSSSGNSLTATKLRLFGNLIKSNLPVNGVVTAYAYDTTKHTQAFGMKTGEIYIYDSTGNIRHLVGHRSPISQLDFRDGRLYSSSFDGTVDFWNPNDQKPEPMTIVTANSWIRCFSLDLSNDYIWTGTQDGTLMQTLISAPKMYQYVKSALKRTYTPEERKMYLNE